MLIILSFWFGGYVGYLSALVDADERDFIERVRASSDRERLEKELARAKSILDARKRAYERRSRAFLDAQRLSGISLTEDAQDDVSEESQDAPESQESSVDTQDQQSDPVVKDPLEGYPVQIAQTQQQLAQMQQSLSEEKNDLEFFEDQVDVIEQILAREIDDVDMGSIVAGANAPQRFTGKIEQLLKLIDKRHEIVEEREIAKDQYQYWRLNRKSAPSDIGITVHNKDGKQRELNPVHVTQISTALSIMPSDFDGRLKNLYVVYGDPKMRRGLSGVGVLFMKGEELDFFRVLIHELGHIFDLHREGQSGPKSEFYDGKYRLYVEDPSVEFYEFGWKNNFERTADNLGYASAYGMSDPFEDFAEAFALYVLQNKTFAQWSDESLVIAKKYDYFLDIFDGRTFPAAKSYLARPYDVTMLLADYEFLLGL